MSSTPARFSLANVWTILKKDLKKAPGSGIVLLAFGYPVLITMMIQLIFGQVFDPPPRIGLMHAGDSAIAQAIIDAPSAEVTVYDDKEAMWAAVAAGDLDLGMALPAGIDAAIEAGEPIDAEGHASTLANPQALIKAEALLLTVFLDAGPELPVTIERVTILEDPPKPWVDRLVPLIILLTFFVAGTFLTGFALVDEKVRGTLKAILTTPTSMLELLLSKAIFSYGVAMLCGLITLALNDAFSSVSLPLALAFTLAAIMTIELGMIIGLLSKDVNVLYGAVKGIGPVLVVSSAPFLWEAFPKWVAQVFPTWWVLAPIMDIVNHGAGLPDVAVDLGIASVICVALVFAVRAVSLRTMSRLDAAT
jgi:ABC-2 type transport system permease protein